jgi:hypothetical protein
MQKYVEQQIEKNTWNLWTFYELISYLRKSLWEWVYLFSLYYSFMC